MMAASAPAPGAPPEGPVPRAAVLMPPVVDIVLAASSVSEADVAQALPAWQAQISRHVRPLWGVDATLALARAPSPGHFACTIAETTDQPEALGYHVLAQDGTPRGIVFVATARAAGVDWRSVASHELVEMLVDPQAALGAQDGARWWALEACDPVEDRTYVLQGVPVSDVVTPQWFREGADGPYDLLGALAAPHTITPGGYAMVWTTGGWSSLGGAERRDLGDARKAVRLRSDPA